MAKQLLPSLCRYAWYNFFYRDDFMTNVLPRFRQFLPCFPLMPIYTKVPNKQTLPNAMCIVYPRSRYDSNHMS